MEFGATVDRDEPTVDRDEPTVVNYSDIEENPSLSESDYYPPSAPNNDLPGVLGIVFGGITVLCLIPAIGTLGFLGISFCLAAPFGMTGTGLSFCSKSKLRFGGLIFNVTVLGISVFGMLLASLGVFTSLHGFKGIP